MSISINNLNDFGLILKIPHKITDIINYNDLCSELFKLWDKICKKLGLNEETIISYFNLFLSLLIKRMNKSISEWIQQITNKYDNLKE